MTSKVSVRYLFVEELLIVLAFVLVLRQLFAKSNIEFLLNKRTFYQSMSINWSSWQHSNCRNAHYMTEWRLSMFICYLRTTTTSQRCSTSSNYYGQSVCRSQLHLVDAYKVQFHEDVIQHFYFKILLSQHLWLWCYRFSSIFVFVCVAFVLIRPVSKGTWEIFVEQYPNKLYKSRVYYK